MGINKHSGGDPRTNRLLNSLGDERQEQARRARTVWSGGLPHFHPGLPPIAWDRFHSFGESQRHQHLAWNRPVPRHANHHGGVGTGAERDVRNFYCW